MRPAREMSFSFTDTPASPTKASTIGSREKVASAGASSTFVHMISEFGMLAPLLAVLVWADRKLTIGGPGEGISLGALMNCTRRGDRQPGIRLTGMRRAPYSIGTQLVKGPPGLSTGSLRLDRFGRLQSCRLTQAAGLGRGCAFRARLQGTCRRGALHARIGHRQDQALDRRP